MTEAETRNGIASAAMPIKTVEIKLEEIGYPGWYVRMRTNPRSSVYDSLAAQVPEVPKGETLPEEEVRAHLERWWGAFGQVVQEWNFADENGKPLPHPKDVKVEADLDLPIGILHFVLTRYFAAFAAAAALPKAQPAPSGPTSSTSDGDQKTE